MVFTAWSRQPMFSIDGGPQEQMQCDTQCFWKGRKTVATS